MLVLFFQCYSQFPGAREITENKYPNCIELFNDSVRVVLEPNLGGRILVYALNEKNVLYVDKKDDGRIYEPGVFIHPSAGRFDIGPEHTIPPHPKLYMGMWSAKITGPRQAEMISQADSVTGVQLVRKFKLAKSGSMLEFTQIIRNIGQENRCYCHWGRTLAKGGGIALAPVNNNSRYPEKYIIYGPGKIMNFRPENETNIRVKENIMEITDTPSQPKIITDSYDGWLAYITKDDQLFIKKFPVFSNKTYGEMAANTACIFYKELYCEVEPIGPMEFIKPGQEKSFTEYWYLFDFTYPANKNVSRKKIMELLGQLNPKKIN